MQAEPITADAVRSILPQRPDDGHKGTFGHVIIIGGSRRYPGAPRLAALGALRSGTGLVTLAMPPSVRNPAADLFEVITIELPESGAGGLRESGAKQALNHARDKSACVVGPGIGMQLEGREFVLGFLDGERPPTVVDADALNAVAEHGALEKLSGTIITPHPGEMARLMRCETQNVQADRVAAASTFAQSHGCVTVLKGHGTLVASPEGTVHVCGTGNHGMAKGGSGDVLAGLIGGLSAQGLSAIDAAVIGVFVHGLAGDLAAEQVGARGMIARDIADAIPLAWKAIDR